MKALFFKKIAILFLIFLFLASIKALAAERDSQIEAFLAEGKGTWISTEPKYGKELLYLFNKNGIYCGGETNTWRKSCGYYWVFSDEHGYFLKLQEKDSGQIIRIRFKIIESYLIEFDGRSLKRQSP